MHPRAATIREQRERLGYGLNRFAATVGVSASHLSRIERGQRQAQPEVMSRIARGLETTIEAITWEVEGEA